MSVMLENEKPFRGATASPRFAGVWRAFCDDGADGAGKVLPRWVGGTKAEAPEQVAMATRALMTLELLICCFCFDDVQISSGGGAAQEGGGGNRAVGWVRGE